MEPVDVWPQLKWHNARSAATSATEAARNCACASGAALVSWSTRGVANPTHHDFRIAAGDPRDDHGLPRGLSSSEVLKAMLSFGALATRYYAEPFGTLTTALQAGKAAQCMVDYATINGFDGGKYSGQKTFRGGHSLVVQGWVEDDPDLGGRNSTTDHDPLYDGRCKSWGCAPSQPQPVPFAMIRQALGNFRVGGATYATGKPIGAGLGVFVIVSQAETPEETIARLTAELAACRAETPEQTIARLEAELAACKGGQP